MLNHWLKNHPRNIKSIDVCMVHLLAVISDREFMPASHIVGTDLNMRNSFLREALELSE